MQLRLRPAELGDIDFILALEAEDDASQWIRRWSRARHEQALGEPDEATLIVEAGSQRLGFVLLGGLTSEVHSIELRRIVVRPRGEGLGRRTLRLILDLAFDQLGAHRVSLDLKVENDRARRAYEAVGFVHEGVLREAAPGIGRYEPLIVMSMLEHQR